MQLLTRVDIPEYPFEVGYLKRSLLMGSCFTEHIGGKLIRYLFPVTVNPFGVVYNPLSLHRSLDALLHRESYGESDLDHHNGLWFSFDHYTGFSDPDRDRCLQKINREFTAAREAIRNAGTLMLSLGTAWAFRHKEKERVVGNCHKLPASVFTRYRLTPGEVTEAWVPLISELQERNSDLNIILTVSPVRHWKDGASGNQLSKSVLLLACESLVKEFPGKVFYFPSYEIVMDELRDYRFYAEDMLHMGPQAISYIWDKFGHAFFSKETGSIIRDLEPLLKLMEHRPRQSSGAGVKELETKRAARLRDLQQKYPFLEWKGAGKEIQGD